MDTARVEDLDRFGHPIDDMPRAIIARQAMVMVGELRRRYGTVGLLRMLPAIAAERRRLRLTHPVAVADLERDFGPGAVNEALSMTALFNTLAPREGREGAYEVARTIFAAIAPRSMEALYQSRDLAACEGDRFENFKKFHMAMFDGSQELFANTQSDAGDAFTTTVTRCGNVEAFRALGAPELGRLGCDHDLAGYPTIVDRHDVVFRRPTTIAKGGTTCRFLFYRRGTEPATEDIEGEPVEWAEDLNR